MDIERPPANKRSALVSDVLRDDTEESEGEQEENMEYFETFKMQATQGIDDGRPGKKASSINHSKLTEQLMRIIHKGVCYVPYLETKRQKQL
jgi:hypothetical protein